MKPAPPTHPTPAKIKIAGRIGKLFEVAPLTNGVGLGVASSFLRPKTEFSVVGDDAIVFGVGPGVFVGTGVEDLVGAGVDDLVGVGVGVLVCVGAGAADVLGVDDGVGEGVGGN